MKSSRYANTLLAATLGLFIAVGSTQAFAQDGTRHGSRGGMSMNYIAGQLDITEEQQAQVGEILRRIMSEQRDAMRQSMRQSMEETPRAERTRPSAEDMAERRAQMNVLIADELGTVLRPDQIEGLLTYMNAHTPMAGGRMQGRDHHRSGPRPH